MSNSYFLIVIFFLQVSCQSVEKNASNKTNKVEQKIQTKDAISCMIINPHKNKIELFWKNDAREIIGSLENLNKHCASKNKKLLMAMNAGMYDSAQNAQGLFIQNNKTIQPINLKNGEANFYLKPNGIFFIDNKNNAQVIDSKKFVYKNNITFATQSGPMLVIDSQLHPQFKQGSTHVHYRNGVGILPNGNVLFAISNYKINLYDFAKYFQTKGCAQALYLDGFVSRMYAPSIDKYDVDGDFGVMIGVME